MNEGAIGFMSSSLDVHYGEEMGDKMEAVVMTAPEKLEIQSVPVPEPSIGEVLIKVECTTICGTDIEIIKGGSPPQLASPTSSYLGTRMGRQNCGDGPDD